MANSGFRGDRVHIPSITIKEVNGLPMLSCAVHFTSEEGAVHAQAAHNFALDVGLPDDAGLTPAAQELLALVIKRVEALHFKAPNDSGTAVLQGIAETLRSQVLTSSDEPGTQG
jgi:hypothetical protein